MFLGGVTRRFPDLRFAFLEGGVGWGCQLFCDLIEHWERRGAKGLQNMDPTKLNRQMLREMVDKYGYDDIAAELDKRDGWPLEEDFLTGGDAARRLHPLQYHAEAGLDRPLRHAVLFRLRGGRPDERGRVRQDDAAWARGSTRSTARISGISTSSTCATRCPRRWSWSRTGPSPQDDFRDFTFANAVRLWGTQNPRFFEGTPVAKEAAAVLKASTLPRLQDAAK